MLHEIGKISKCSKEFLSHSPGLLLTILRDEVHTSKGAPSLVKAV